LAVRTLRKAISMDPKNDLTHFLLGQALRAIGDEQNAQKEFGIARELKAASNQSDQEILKPKQ
jgi:Flp pilus assembly protein TadD